MRHAPRFSDDFGVAGSVTDTDFDALYTKDIDDAFESICDDWSLDDDTEMDIELLH